jgi:hypothetical protein
MCVVGVFIIFVFSFAGESVVVCFAPFSVRRSEFFISWLPVPDGELSVLPVVLLRLRVSFAFLFA